MDKVTCAACGLLTIRNSETWELCEVDDLYRKEGKLHGSIGGKRIATPICFAGQFQLQEDHQRWKKAKGVSDDDCLVYTFTDERDCPSFQKWILGLAPKEHVDMLLLEKQREWQRKCEAEDRQWREDQASLAESRHQQNLKVVADATAWNWRAVLTAAGIGALATLLAGILGRRR